MAGWREPLPTTSFFFRLFCFDPATVSVEESVVDHFDIALFSALEQTHCALVASDSERVTSFLRHVFDWIFTKAVFLQRCFLVLHWWRYVKLLPPQCFLCTLYNYVSCHVPSKSLHFISMSCHLSSVWRGLMVFHNDSIENMWLVHQ